MWLHSINKFDIYLAKINYHEEDGRSKNRPVVLLGINTSLEVAPITGTLTGDKYILLDWSIENLAKESAVYLPTHKLDLNMDIRNISKSDNGIFIGHLTKRDIIGLSAFLDKHSIKI